MSSLSVKQEYLWELSSVAKILFKVIFLNNRNNIFKSNSLGIFLSSKNIFRILAGDGQGNSQSGVGDSSIVLEGASYPNKCLLLTAAFLKVCLLFL